MKNKYLKIIYILFLFCVATGSATAQTRPSWVQIKDKPALDIREFGARAGGIIDCSAAFVAANASATAAGVSISVPEGEFLLSSNVTLTADLISYGTLSGSGVTTIIVGASNISVLGGFYGGVRFEALNKNDLNISKATIFNVNGWGISFKGVTNGVISENTIYNIDYESTFLSADGIFIGGCENVLAENNVISDFERIGITSDSLPGVATQTSDHIVLRGNSVSNAHDSDKSASEYNAAIWAENTNNVLIENNNCFDICGNANQTRSVGMKASSVSKPCVQIIRNNRIDDSLLLGSAGTIYVPKITVDNNTFTAQGRTTILVSVDGAFSTLDLIGNSFGDVATSTSAVTSNIYIAPESNTGCLRLSKNTFDTVQSLGSANIFFGGSYKPAKTLISDQHNTVIAGIVSIATGSELVIENSSVYLSSIDGTASTAGFERLIFSNSTLLGDYVAGSKYKTFTGSTFPHNLVLACPGNSDTRAISCTFVGGVTHYAESLSSTFISDCLFTGKISAGVGAGMFATNAIASATRDLLTVSDCVFIMPSPDPLVNNYAIIKNGDSPANSFFTDNMFDTGAAGGFTDVTATSTNNIDFDF